jgi:hypothetical protein
MKMLNEAAAAVISIQNMNLSPMMQTMSASPMLLAPKNMAKLIKVPDRKPADPGDIGTTNQALSVDDFKGIVDCLQAAKYSWSGPFIVNICMSKACADTFVGLLGLGTGTLLTAGVALILKGVGAALSAAGGWVALGILLSAAAWALMIYLNATPRGVCIHIPMPWTFGLIGPGWASGIPA